MLIHRNLDRHSYVDFIGVSLNAGKQTQKNTMFHSIFYHILYNTNYRDTKQITITRNKGEKMAQVQKVIMLLTVVLN